MEDEIQFLLDTLKEQMNKSIAHLEHEYRSIRAGKANPAMLSTVMVDYYGSMTPLQQIANLSIMDAHTLTVQPWERNMLNVIEKATDQDFYITSFYKKGKYMWKRIYFRVENDTMEIK